MEDFEVFPSQIWSLSLTKLAVRGRVLSCKRMIPSDNIPGRFDIIARGSTLSHQETNHTSLLFFACLHFQWSTNTTLTSRSIKKQLCGLVRFHYACLLPYSVAVSIRNSSVASFSEECSLWRVFGFHLTAPHIYVHFKGILFLSTVCVCVCVSNTNPLHYYVLQVPRKADTWHWV